MEAIPRSATDLGGRRIYSVGELTRMVKGVLESAPTLSGLLVKGEISNFKHHTSGHMYFTLKDDRGRLKCVMFRGKNASLKFAPGDGMTVIAGGSIGLYEVAGEYQLYVDELYPAGVGALHLAFEQLKERLASEGLFALERKRPLPFLPTTVGVVTSPTGAAIRDILSVLGRRFPNINIVIAPALVQGEGGPDSVVSAIRRMNERRDIDVLIVGRGGGSLEELWTFNDERVARAIAASRIPVISAVGHETDVTIADFVADKRAPTPSAAAEMAVPEREALLRHIRDLSARLVHAERKLISRLWENLRYLEGSPVLTRPAERIRQLNQEIDDLLHRAALSFRHGVEQRRAGLKALTGKLDGLSPLGTLARGYAICLTEETGDVVTHVGQVAAGQGLRVRVTDGEIACRVTAPLRWTDPDPGESMTHAGSDGK